MTLPIPDSNELEVLITDVEASIPDLEKDRPQRNDELLASMAERTQGHYQIGIPDLDATGFNSPPLDQLIQPQDQISYLTGSVNLEFRRKLMIWLWMIITSVLALEWVIRRLHKLA